MVVVKGRTIKLVRWIGGLVLVLYGVIATFQVFPTFGRVYAAYGGVFIIMSIIWSFVFDKQIPDKYDVLGAVVCIIGVLIMILPNRARSSVLRGRRK